MPVSNRTCAAFSSALAEWTHANISVIALRYGKRGVDPTGVSCKHRAVAFVEALGCGQDRDEDQENELRDAIEHLLSQTTDRAFEHSDAIALLVRELELDGFVFRDQRLMPTTAGPLPLATQSSDLEASLEQAGLLVALKHYRQALDNFARANYEAAGGSIGSFLENLFEEVAAHLTGTRRPEPRASLDALRDDGFLQAGQWNFLRGCWSGVQEGGRHQGTSEHELALLRIQTGTAAGQFLLTLLDAPAAT